MQGKALIDEALLQQAASLYVELKYVQILLPKNTFSAAQNTAANVCSLARKVLLSDWYYHNHQKPRYCYYINESVLQWSLNRLIKFSNNQPDVACWCAIKLLIKDQIQYERQLLLEGSLSTQDTKIIEKRLALLNTSLTHLPEVAHQLTDNAQVIKAKADDRVTWANCAADGTGIRALLHLTAFPQSSIHDEYLFIRVVQITECCLEAIHLLLDTMFALSLSGDYGKAKSAVAAAADFAYFLTPLFIALKTMPAKNFLAFREATGNSSAVQSRRYQGLQQRFERMPMVKQPVVAEIPETAKFATPLAKYKCASTLLDTIPRTETGFIDEIYRLDAALFRWRCLHLSIAKAYLANMGGTGGTDGITYLESHFKHRLKP